MRTEYCGNVTKEHLGKDVSICGWVHRRRDHGGVIFLDVRDLEPYKPDRGLAGWPSRRGDYGQ